MGERPLDFRDEHVLPAWRRRDGAEYGGPAYGGLDARGAVDRRKLARANDRMLSPSFDDCLRYAPCEAFFTECCNHFANLVDARPSEPG